MKEQHSSHLRKIGACLHQLLNLRNANLLWTLERRCIWSAKKDLNDAEVDTLTKSCSPTIVVKTTPQKTRFSRWEICKNLGYRFEWTMTGHNRTTTSRRKELCTWCCVCVVKCSWRIKPSCWMLRRPTPMTTWKPRSRESTRSTTWTRERARSCYSLRSQFCFVTLIPCTHRIMAQDVCVCASFHPMVIAMHAWVERSLRLPWPFYHLHLPPLIHHYPQAVPSTLQLHRG